MSFLQKYKNIIIIVIVISFIGGLFYAGYNSFSVGLSNHETIAKVGNEKIKARQYNRIVEQQERELRRLATEDFDDDGGSLLNYLKQRALQTLMFQSAMVQSAEKYGIHTPDFEIAYMIQTAPAFTNNGLFSKQAYVWTVRNQLMMTPAEFENQERRNMQMNKMANIIMSSYKSTPEELLFNYKTQYGTIKDYAKKKEDFIPTVAETKSLAAQDAFLIDFNSKNEIKSLIQE
ncbi:hypothetical protein Emin_0179 [Elusimicrobium minutum Pei191]|uniref:Peptidylprolyl isomerase n=1 Tax=Elusimicrobium minutum (strain Pei191) TaxID=445932 RepID=B2KBQ6_ELUMP|nr:SurA N-terminal domain-containing protein [Elusimicrobium minutum]ACC97743.1 hypothetical protein Emin_0179 [Elusimicrobium minutum Pei191]